MPEPGQSESREEFISRCIPILRKEGKSQDQAVAICNSLWSQKRGKEMHRLITTEGLKVKEDGEELLVVGLAATTHPDRENDVLSIRALEQIRDAINNEESAGGKTGAFRSVSLYHDWIHEQDPTLDEAAFLKPTATIIELEDGHKGVQVEAEINKFYKGPMTPEEIKYRIEKNGIAGFSIEYETDDSHSKTVKHDGKQFRWIEELTEFGGLGFARARMIANPNAVIFKEIEKKAKEARAMTETEKQEVKDKAQLPSKKEEAKEEEKKVLASKQEDAEGAEDKVEEGSEEAGSEEEEAESGDAEAKETKKKSEKSISAKEIMKDFTQLVRDELQVKNKTIKTGKEAETMEALPLSVKEMNAALRGKEGKMDVLAFKEAASRYFREHPEFEQQMKTTGIPLQTSLSVKCDGNKLRIVSQLASKQMETKDTLDTTTNTEGTYGISIVEFADVYLPAIIDTFNQLTNLFGQMPKRDHLEGGNQYGWRITTDQSTGLSVDPDDTAVIKRPVGKEKLRTDIKEYRVGVSVTDYVLHHSRASIGDLFMIEVEKRTRDLMKDINGDLFTEQVDSGTQVLGLEAVADSAGNTSIYGKTRTTANRLAPDAASDTYNAVGGALTQALARGAPTLVEQEGAQRGNLRFVANPAVRDILFNLEDGAQRHLNTNPNFGFAGLPVFDGIPIIVDPDAQTDALFVVDFESYYAVISRPPQLIGLAKVGAAEEAYVSIYLAVVYEQPRRIHMLDTIS